MQLAAAESHPDANLLTAFAEHSLTVGEREQVLGHLSGCADCREVVALAGSPLVEPVPEPARKRGLWEMPLFHWGAVAATTVVVVAAVSIGVREHRSAMTAEMTETPPQRTQTSSRQADEVNAALASPKEQVQPQPEKKIEAKGMSPAAAPVVTRRAKHLQEEVRYERPSTTLDEKKAPAGVVGGVLAAKAPLAPPAPSANDYAAASTTVNANVNGRNVNEVVQMPAATDKAASNQAANKQPSRIVLSTSESVEVNAEAPVVVATGGPVAAPAMAKQQNGVGAATMLTAPTSSGQATTIKSATTGTEWHITNFGELQQSSDGGKKWKSQLRHHTVSAMAVVGDHIWTGGDNGTLFVSSDNGRHWKQMAIQSGNIAATGSIVRVRFSDAQNGSVDTSTGETWSTSDGGQSWHK